MNANTTRTGVLALSLTVFAAAAGEAAIQVGQAQVSKTLKQRLTMIKGGTFRMGDVFGEGARMATPVHQVTVSDFYLGKCEVTVAEFEAFVKATGTKTSAESTERNGAWVLVSEEDHRWEAGVTWREPRFEQSERCPVTCVSWSDAARYCNWLSRSEGLAVAYDVESGNLLDERGEATTDVTKVRGYRLPTEAEWEYAAREGGKKVRFGNGQNVARAGEINFDAGRAKSAYTERGEFRGRTVPVGSFEPNALGLHDMSGNVWEWCSDFLGTYGDKAQVNPYQTQGLQDRRAVRSGPWVGGAKWQQVTERIGWVSDDRCNNIGFRVARSK